MRFLLIFLLIYCSSSYIIGIDFGTQYIKVAYQSYNKPPDIVLDPSGKRKIDNAVYFAEDQRVFGNNAISSSTLKPESVFVGINELLGQGGESNKPATFQQRGYPYSFELTDRNTWMLRLPKGTGLGDISTVSVEEMNAMVLNYLVSIVENEYNEKDREVVISVPSLFTQEQRQSLLDAAKLANIRVLAIIDHTTASAVTYAMTRHSNGIKHLLLMDVGSHYTEVSAVQIEVHPDKNNKNKSLHNVVILGKESIDVGGDDFTNVLLSNIADFFEQEYKEDPRKNVKTYNRLRMQSQKYKEILSANREVLITEANLIDGKDLQFTLSREEFEEDCVSILHRISKMVEDLLHSLHLSKVFFLT